MNKYNCDKCINNGKGSVFHRNRKCAACFVDSDNLYEGKPSNYEEKSISVMGEKTMNVFENLSEEKAKEMIDKLIAEGYSEENASTEVYAIECNMDSEENI